MNRKKTFGQIIITAMFVWSALLCHFEASSQKEEGNIIEALMFWFFGLTALLGAFRFKIAAVIENFINYKNQTKK